MEFRRPDSYQVSINLPFGLGGIQGTWEPNDAEKKAAWEMYIELATRISAAPLDPEDGILREALSSMHSIFGTTRDILRQYGPEVAQYEGKERMSFGYLAIEILNNVLRPLLAKWHPLLQSYESKRSDKISVAEHERNWERNQELRQEIDKVRTSLVEYIDTLANVAGVPPLTLFSRTSHKD
jgi:hypothetical protein